MKKLARAALLFSILGISTTFAKTGTERVGDARCVPVSKAGINGYRCTNIKKGSALYTLGVRNGDVIVALNGRTLIKDPGEAFNQLRELKTSNKVKVDLSRDGKRLVFDYDIK